MQKKQFLFVILNLIITCGGQFAYAQNLTCAEFLTQTTSLSVSDNKFWGIVDRLFMKNTRITNPVNMNELFKGEQSGYFRNRQSIESLGYEMVDYKITPRFKSFDDFHQKYKRLVRTKINEWNTRNPNQPIEPNEVILDFVFPFYNLSAKKWLALDYRQPIPVGYELVVDKLPPGIILYPSLAAGRFPVVLNTLAYHDVLGHSLSWALNPNYAKVYRALAKHVVERGGWPYLNALPTRAQRMFYFNESFFLIDKSILFAELNKTKLDKDAIDLMTSQRRTTSHKDAAFDDQSYLPFLDRMSDEEIEELSDQLILMFPKAIIKFGGALNDGLHLDIKAINALYYIEAGFDNTFDRLNSGSIRSMELKNRIALTLAILSLKSTFNVEDWANDLVVNDDNKQGLFTTYFDLLVLMGQQTRPFDRTFEEY